MVVDQATSEKVDLEPRPPKKRLPRGEVHIFDNWCKGCGLCIEFCPAGVLVLGINNRPQAIYPEKCTACRWCELHCPDFAIFVSDIQEDANDVAGDAIQQVDSPTSTIEPAETEPEPENL